MTRTMTASYNDIRPVKALLAGGIICWIGLNATVAHAQGLTFPGNATLQIREENALTSYDVPVDIWADNVLPVTTVEGNVTREAWRIATAGLTSLQLLRPLREQLQNDRFRIIFECQTEACGGFDFRFATATLPPPEMQINLGDFRFLTAVRDSSDGPEYVTLFASPTAQAGFVQITRVGSVQAPLPDPVVAPAVAPVAAPEDGGLVAQLDTVGRAILSNLDFATSSAVLVVEDQPVASLTELARYLNADADRIVALVGHTDSTGGTEANMNLSKRRAGAVLERLVSAYDVDRRQLTAEGAGYLAPIATNRTEAGREMNRRVEVVMLSAP